MCMRTCVCVVGRRGRGSKLSVRLGVQNQCSCERLMCLVTSVFIKGMGWFMCTR